MKYVLISLFLGIVSLLMFSIYMGITSYSENYLKSTSFDFYGKVHKIKELGRHDIVSLKDVESTIDCYDPSDTLDVFFCKISDTLIEAVISSDNIEIGDEIMFNGERNKYAILRNSKRVDIVNVFVSPLLLLDISNDDFELDLDCK